MRGSTLAALVLPLAADLAQALGREHAVHAAIKAGGIAEKTIVAARRFVALAQGPETGARELTTKSN